MTDQELQGFKKKIQDDIEWAEETLNEFHYNGCACTKHGALYTKLENTLQQYKFIQECIEAYEQLQKYKKLEEENRLQILPCAPGAEIYIIEYKEGTCCCPDYDDCPVLYCYDCPYDGNGEFIITPHNYNPNRHISMAFGTNIFTTEQAAKERIAELEAKINDVIS